MRVVNMYYPELTAHAVARMIEGAERRPVFAAVWAFRLALFSGALVIVGIALHRLLGLPTPVLLNAIQVGFICSVLAILLALVAMVHIWLSGRTGTGMTLLAILASLALLAWPALYLSSLRDLPAINDVTTDLHAPPAMNALAQLRGPGANPVEYPEAFAEMQAVAYPDLQPFLIPRSGNEAFELVADTVRHLKYRIVSETPPGDDFEKPGVIEAVDRTPIIGFYDDVVIRIHGDEQSAQIDVRSASRYGEHDFGRNASRIRAFFHEVRTKLDSTVPAAETRGERSKQKSGKGAVPKRRRAGDRGRGRRRSE